MLPREETTKMVVEDLQNEGDFATVGVVEYGHWLTGGPDSCLKRSWVFV
jgi:hypothetical protein